MFENALVEQIGWILIHSVWQITVLVFLAALGYQILSRHSANSRYVLGCTVLFIMMLAPVITSGYGSPPPATFSPDNRPRISSQSSSPIHDVETLSGRQTVTATKIFRPLTEDQMEFNSESGTTASVGENPATLLVNDTSEAGSISGLLTDATNWLHTLMPSVVIVWISGVVLLSVRPLVGFRTVQELRNTRQPDIPEMIQDIVSRLCERMAINRPVEVAASTRLDVPAVVGTLRPLLLFPISTITGLTRQQIEAVAAHELAHVRRHDYIVNIVQTMAETLFFYHPGVWWLSARIRQERENCCDDIALEVCRNRAIYASTLVAIDALRRQPPQPIIASNGGELLQRIRRLTLGRPQRRPTSIAWLTFAFLFMAAIVGGGILSNQSRKAEAREAHNSSLDISANNPDEPLARDHDTPHSDMSTTGGLRGRFIFRGVPPERQRIRPTPRSTLDGKQFELEDDTVLNRNVVLDESLVIDKDGGLANVFVWVRNKDIPFEPKELPPVRLHMAKGRFAPHVTLLQTHQDFVVTNDHDFATNWRFRSYQNTTSNVLLSPRSNITRKFDSAEPGPVPTWNDIHPWMSGLFLVRDNPFFALSGPDGTFELAGLPPGEWEFQFWHEKPGYLQRDEWPKGRVVIQIAKETRDLGTITITEEHLGIVETPQSIKPRKPRANPTAKEPNGTLRGRFVLEGRAPRLVVLKPDRDISAVQDVLMYDESLVVDDNGGIANVFVYLRDMNVPAPENIAMPPQVLSMRGLRARPHAFGIQRGQHVVVKNENAVGVNAHFTSQFDPRNMMIQAKSHLDLRFTERERMPVRIVDSLHPWISAYMLVHHNPYFAVSTTDGRFEIQNLPPGEWEFQIWHELAGYPKRDVWPRGRVKVHIKPGVNEFGTVKLDRAEFDLFPEHPYADVRPIRGDNPVWAATSNLDKQRVLRLLDQDPKLINRPNQTGFVPLHRAAMGGDIKQVDLLLDVGADVDAIQSKYGGTALRFAAANGHLEVCKLLLNHDAAVDHPATGNYTPLMLATSNGHAAVAQLLVEHRANVNAQTTKQGVEEGSTALHFAVRKGNQDVVELLLKHGADRKIRNKAGNTAFSAPSKSPARQPDSEWYRALPIPGLEVPGQTSTDELAILLLSNAAVHRELGLSMTLGGIFAQLKIWTADDVAKIPDDQREQRNELWSTARQRAYKLLNSQQMNRLQQLLLQQRGHEVFLHPEMIPELKITRPQHVLLAASWQTHKLDSLVRKTTDTSRITRLPVIGEFDPQDPRIIAELRRRDSYKKFWNEIRRILTSEQRNIYISLRGPALRATRIQK